MSEETSTPSNAGKSLSTASLIIGIIAVVIAIIPVVGFLAYILGTVGLILGIIGLIKAIIGKAPKGKAIVGIVLNFIAYFVPMIATLLFFGGAASAVSSF